MRFDFMAVPLKADMANFAMPLHSKKRSARRRSFNHISSERRISSRDDREPAALRKSCFSQETSPFCRRSSRTMGMAMVTMTTALISPTPSRVTKSPNT